MAIVKPHTKKIPKMIARSNAVFWWEARLEINYSNGDKLKYLRNFAINQKPPASQFNDDAKPVFKTNQLNGHPAVQLEKRNGQHCFMYMNDKYLDVFTTSFAIIYVGQYSNNGGGENFRPIGVLDSNKNSMILPTDRGLAGGERRLNIAIKSNDEFDTIQSDSPFYSGVKSNYMTSVYRYDIGNKSMTVRKNGSQLSDEIVNGDNNNDMSNYDSDYEPFLFVDNKDGTPDNFMSEPEENPNCAAFIILKNPSLTQIQNVESDLNSIYNIY